MESLAVGEFENAALAKVVATDGIGITVAPIAVLADAIERYGFLLLGGETSARSNST